MRRARSMGRDALVERMRRARDDIQEGLFNAAAYWNSLHPHEEPIDPDPDGSMRRCLDALHRTLTREDAQRNLTATPEALAELRADPDLWVLVDAADGPHDHPPAAP